MLCVLDNSCCSLSSPWAVHVVCYAAAQSYSNPLFSPLTLYAYNGLSLLLICSHLSALSLSGSRLVCSNVYFADSQLRAHSPIFAMLTTYNPRRLSCLYPFSSMDLRFIFSAVSLQTHVFHTVRQQYNTYISSLLANIRPRHCPFVPAAGPPVHITLPQCQKTAQQQNLFTSRLR